MYKDFGAGKNARAAVIVGCLVFLLCGIAQPADAQEQAGPSIVLTDNSQGRALPPSAHLDLAHVLVRMATEIQGTEAQETELDCSHFVQYVYQQAGLDFAYAPSRILYTGQPGFIRVFHAKIGDLVVWLGHVGIVVSPREKSFLSSLNSGVRISSYASSYWQKRGNPRFFRYLHSNMAVRQSRTKITDDHVQRTVADSE